MSIVETVQKTLNFLRRRKQNYQLAFMSPAGQEVLQDLIQFCRADRTCFDPDPRIHAALEGRREVWLRIQQHLGLTAEQLLVLYSGAKIQPTGDDNA
jgi:hypothetical protein